MRSSVSYPSGVIFDLDGVIVDSAEPHRRSWELLAEEHGLQMPEKLFHETFGQPNQQILPRLFRRELSEEETRIYSDRKEFLYRDLVRNKVKAFPGAVELIRALRAHTCPIAIGSSAPRENIDLVLDFLAMTDAFHVIVSSRDVIHGKPDPEVFQVAARRLNLPRASCVVIEDAVAGVKAAKAAGMKCIAVTNTHPARSLQDADWVVDSLENVPYESMAGLWRDEDLS